MMRSGVLCAIACALLAAFVLLPLLQAVTLSFTATLGTEGVPVGLTGLHNYVEIFQTPALRQSILNSTLTVTGGKPINVAIGALFSFQTNWGLVMAITVFSIAPGVLMIFLVRNHIARGFVVRT